MHMKFEITGRGKKVSRIRRRLNNTSVGVRNDREDVVLDDPREWAERGLTTDIKKKMQFF